VNDPAQAGNKIYCSSPASGSIQEVCPAGLELVLVLDASGSVDDADFRLTQQFGKDLMANFIIGDKFTKMSIIHFSSSAEKIIGLSGDATSIALACDTARRSGGTDIALGISTADSELTSNGRADVNKIILLVSDGSSDKTAAVNAANTAKNKGYRMITMAVGSGADEDVLKSCASSLTDFHKITSYTQLLTDIAKLAEEVCVSVDAVTPPNVCCGKETGVEMDITGRGLSSTNANVAGNVKCKFGTHATTTGSYISDTKMKCPVPTCSGAKTVDLQISIDGGNTFFPNKFPFEYRTCTGLVSATPLEDCVVPAQTVTFTGTGFDLDGANADATKLKCKFGTVMGTSPTYVSDTTFTCKVPPPANNLAATVTLEASTDGGASYYGNTFSFVYKYCPSIISGTPLTCCLKGGCEVTITGSQIPNIGTPNLICKFGIAPAVEATWISGTQIKCVAPASSSSVDNSVDLKVSIDQGVTFIDPKILSFAYTAPEGVCYTALGGKHVDCLKGGKKVEILGSGFDYYGAGNNVSLVKCKFGNAEMQQATYVSSSKLECTAPPFDPAVQGKEFGEVPVKVSLNGGRTFLGATYAFDYVKPEGNCYKLIEATPLSSCYWGGKTTSVTGIGFNYYDADKNTSKLHCKYGSQIVPATVDSWEAPNEISCQSPLWHSTQVDANNLDFSNMVAQFQISIDGGLTYLEPMFEYSYGTCVCQSWCCPVLWMESILSLFLSILLLILILCWTRGPQALPKPKFAAPPPEPVKKPPKVKKPKVKKPPKLKKIKKKAPPKKKKKKKWEVVAAGHYIGATGAMAVDWGKLGEANMGDTKMGGDEESSSSESEELSSSSEEELSDLSDLEPIEHMSIEMPPPRDPLEVDKDPNLCEAPWQLMVGLFLTLGALGAAIYGLHSIYTAARRALETYDPQNPTTLDGNECTLIITLIACAAAGIIALGCWIAKRYAPTRAKRYARRFKDEATRITSRNIEMTNFTGHNANPMYGAKLPPGWEKVDDPATGVYFYNKSTGETSWEAP
jgi:uncharacterized protein YegL